MERYNRQHGRSRSRYGNVRKGRRRRSSAAAMRLVAVLLILITAGVLLKNIFTEWKNTEDGIQTDGHIDSNSLEEVFAQSGDKANVLRDLVDKNAETIPFVLDYPEKKDNPPAETVGEVTQGVIPHLLQWDERWGYQIYGDNMIAVNGCGPTVISMVASGLTGDNTITPYRVAQTAAQQGYYAGDAGTSWSLMTEGAVQFGIYGQEIQLSESSVFSALENGNPVICSMRPGDFTTTGHFIVLTGVEDGKIRVNDPNSRKRSEKLWEYETLEPQIDNLWMYSRYTW